MMKRALLFLAALAATAHAESPRTVLPGTVPVTPFPGHATSLLSDHSSTASGVAVLEISVPPRTFGAPPHVHTREDEHFYVLEGTVEFLDRERTVTAGPGSLLVLPRGHLHGFWNASDEPARLLLVVSPGEFASFFDEVVAEIRRRNSESAAAIGRIVAEVASRHGVQVLPDRVPAAARHLLPDRDVPE